MAPPKWHGFPVGSALTPIRNFGYPLKIHPLLWRSKGNALKPTLLWSADLYFQKPVVVWVFQLVPFGVVRATERKTRSQFRGPNPLTQAQWWAFPFPLLVPLFFSRMGFPSAGPFFLMFFIFLLGCKLGRIDPFTGFLEQDSLWPRKRVPSFPLALPDSLGMTYSNKKDAFGSKRPWRFGSSPNFAQAHSCQHVGFTSILLPRNARMRSRQDFHHPQNSFRWPRNLRILALLNEPKRGSSNR